ncbi:MAG TPA: anti-sigma regulatory factor [Myxococcales bacterium]|jgi:serine/threonine-protein kinase RsbT
MMTLQQSGNETVRRLVDVLQRHVGPLTAQTIVETSCTRARMNSHLLRAEQLPTLVPELEKGLKLFLREPAKQQACLAEIVSAGRGPRSTPRPALMPTLVKVPVNDELGMLEARAMARQIAADLGFSISAQTQIATVVSELARNILNYAGKGVVTLIADPAGRVTLEVVAEDQGPGIPDLDAVLAGTRRSKTGRGLGLRSSRNLMDRFDVKTSPGRGTKVVAAKYRA